MQAQRPGLRLWLGLWLPSPSASLPACQPGAPGPGGPCFAAAPRVCPTVCAPCAPRHAHQRGLSPSHAQSCAAAVQPGPGMTQGVSVRQRKLRKNTGWMPKTCLLLCPGLPAAIDAGNPVQARPQNKQHTSADSRAPAAPAAVLKSASCSACASRATRLRLCVARTCACLGRDGLVGQGTNENTAVAQRAAVVCAGAAAVGWGDS